MLSSTVSSSFFSNMLTNAWTTACTVVLMIIFSSIPVHVKLSLWSIIEQLRHMFNHLLQVTGYPLLLWVKTCNFIWQLMGSFHLLNENLCALHLANVTLRIMSGSHINRTSSYVSVQFLVNFWSLLLQLLHLKSMIARQKHKHGNLTCERALRLIQIHDASLEQMKMIKCDSSSVSFLINKFLWKK